MHSCIEAIEDDFMARRTRPPAVADAFEQGFALVAPAQPTTRSRALHAAGAAIAAAVAAAPVPEPAYHDRHHAIEAMLAMGSLCRIGVAQGLISGHDAMLGVVGMAGHDLGHDGAILPGGIMEARSRRAVQAIASAVRPVLDPADLVAIGALIDATNPAAVPANAARAEQVIRVGQGADAALHHLHRLANEADVFASLLPRLGVRLSRLLATEWQHSEDPARRRIGTATGRLGFLMHYPSLSSAATALGLAAARECCRAAYAAAGRAGSDPATGCAALDRLPEDAARRAYDRALEPLWPRPMP